MLISKITAENKDKLKLFKNSSELVSFAQMANDLIYEMKQYNTTPDGLFNFANELAGDVILKQKLEDIHILYSKYEEYTKEKYLDGEDYLAVITSKVSEAEIVKQSAVWVYGFDYFTPKNMELLKELMKHSREMNVLMTYSKDESDSDLFEITGDMIRKMNEVAELNGVNCETIQIKGSYLQKTMQKSDALKTVERELFAISEQTYEDSAGITLIKSANPYNEIETAAAYVLELVREKGLKYKDIAIICNDLEERAAIARRIFSQYNIELFIDQKRSFMHNAAVKFIVSSLAIITNKYRSADVLSMLKTGMSDISVDNCEELENYIYKYKIKGSKWSKPFTKGVNEYGETLLEIENSRKQLIEFIAMLEKPFSQAKTVRQKVEALYEYLSETAKIPEKLDVTANFETEKGLHDFAEETAQTWQHIINTFDQLVEIMGDEEMSAKDFAGVLQVGFESVELGLLPPTSDGLILGTMQRMRTGKIKALLIIAANEGLLPMAMGKEGLLNDDEKKRLEDRGMEICRREELRLHEEKLAIYKNISKPENYLWISHSISDNDGGKLGASLIFERLSKIFAKSEIQKDILSKSAETGEVESLIHSKESTLMHITNAMRDSITSERSLNSKWEAVAKWYINNENEYYKKMIAGLFFKNERKSIPEELAKELYQRGNEEMSLSPSRLGTYGKCPFSFFINYGVKPGEMRVYEILGREIGEIYHNCIMNLSKKLTKGSSWITIQKEECDEIVDKLIDEEAGEYREGMFLQGAEEAYRTERIKEVCRENAWVLVEHVRSGNIAEMSFEEGFGRAAFKNEAGLPAIEVEISQGKKVLIEGRIDRIDTLADGSVKIIDYKSGREKFNAAEAKAGWRIQLMLYLRAAQKQKAEPAGVFYFTVDEKVDAGRMDGVVIDKASVIDNIAGEFQNYSSIIPVRKLKDGTVKGNTSENLLSEVEFKELQDDVDKKIRELCSELITGCIDIRPKKSNDMTACRYCEYKSVCSFDTAIEGFKYETIY